MNKTLALLAVSIVIMSSALAASSDYKVSMKVLPDVAYEYTNVTVSGYLNCTNWGNANLITDLSLRLLRNGAIYDDYDNTEIIYANDVNNSQLLLDGYFHKDLGQLSDGDYVVQLRIADSMVDYKRFSVLNGTSNLTLNVIDLGQSADTVLLLLDIKNIDPLTPTMSGVSLELYGRKNFNNPIVISGIDVNYGAPYHLPLELAGFNVSDFAGSNEVFGLLIHATMLGQNASPKMYLLNTGLSTAPYSGDVSGQLISVKKNVNTVFKLSIENKGLLRTTYELGLSGSLAPYVELLEHTYELMPGDKVNATLNIMLPKNYSGGNELLVTLRHSGLIVDTLRLTPQILSADKEHAVMIKSVNFNSAQYFPEQNIEGYIIIENTGDYFEDVNVEFDLGKLPIKNAVYLNPGQSRNVTFLLEPQDSDALNIRVYNANLTTETIQQVPLVTKVYSFETALSAYEIISADSDVEIVTLNINNRGNSKDFYKVSITGTSNFVLSKSPHFLLNPQASENLTIKFNIPRDVSELNLTVSVSSELGKEVKNKTLLIHVFRSMTSGAIEPSVNVSETSINAKPSEGVIYSIIVKNNNLISAQYAVEASGTFNGTLTVYPASGVSLQPEETGTLYIYATPELSGEFNIPYTVMEDGVIVSSGSLLLNVNEEGQFSGLTGFIVAAGGVFGVAGLIVLILFIYFFFLRQKPKGGSEDEFKPVEVKKAELGRPKMRNEGDRYW